MGTVGARCLKGCEGGKNEIGEENLEDINLNRNPTIKEKEDKSEHTNNINKARSASTNKNTNMNKFIEENESK